MKCIPPQRTNITVFEFSTLGTYTFRGRKEKGGHKGELPKEGVGLHQEQQPSGPPKNFTISSLTRNWPRSLAMAGFVAFLSVLSLQL